MNTKGEYGRREAGYWGVTKLPLLAFFRHMSARVPPSPRKFALASHAVGLRHFTSYHGGGADQREHGITRMICGLGMPFHKSESQCSELLYYP